MKLGDRIKTYERTSRKYLMQNTPVMIRVDGKAFHTFTKNFDYPFDNTLMHAMDSSALNVMQQMQGCKAAYIQSDEATFLLTDYDNHDTQGWFDYNHSKMVSISASYMTAFFNDSLRRFGYNLPSAVFDSRAFNIPREDVANAFLWRAKDWQRNSLQMFTRKFFSHKELHGKNTEAMHEMLNRIGQNWANLPNRIKNGCFIINNRVHHNIKPTYIDISSALNGIKYIDNN